MKQVLGVDRLSIELKCQASDRTENVKLLLGQAVEPKYVITCVTQNESL